MQKISFSFQQKAALFKQLCLLEKAGIPYAQAFLTLAEQQSSPLIRKKLIQLSRDLNKGRDLAKAGFIIGLFNAFEQNLIQAGSAAGNLEYIYQLLNEHYENKAQNLKKLKSKLYLPAVILILSVFVAPIPAFIIGEISAAGYLGQTLGLLALLAGLVYFIIKIPHILKKMNLGFIWDAILSYLPLFGKIYYRQNTQYFVENLALLLNAGLPILEALPHATNTMPDQQQQNIFNTIKPKIEKGASFSAALSTIQGVNLNLLKRLSISGESAGKLPELLKYYALYEAEELNTFYEQVATWFPRIIYAFVVFWMVQGLLGGSSSSSIDTIKSLNL